MESDEATAVGEALFAYLERYRQSCKSRRGHEARVTHDEQWVSPCTLGKPDASGRQLWAPCPREHASFEGLERALETTLHPSIHGYYTRYWFPPVPALADDGQLELIGMWNEDDFESLQSNIIGHALQQRRRKLPLTVFFALGIGRFGNPIGVEYHPIPRL